METLILKDNVNKNYIIFMENLKITVEEMVYKMN